MNVSVGASDDQIRREIKELGPPPLAFLWGARAPRKAGLCGWESSCVSGLSKLAGYL